MSDLRATSERIFGVSGAIAALSGGADFLEAHVKEVYPRAPEWIFDVTLIAAVASTLVAVLSALTWVGVYSENRFKTRPDVQHNFHPTEPHEIVAVHSLASGRIGATISDVENTERCIAKHKGSFTTLRRERRYSSGKLDAKFVGYFCALPLSKAATEKVALGQLTGVNLDAEHLVSEGDMPFAIYVGGVAGRNEWAQGMLMQRLREEILRAKRDGVRFVFARGATIVGKQRLKDYGFDIVATVGELPLFRLDLQNLSRASMERLGAVEKPENSEPRRRLRAARRLKVIEPPSPSP